MEKVKSPPVKGRKKAERGKRGRERDGGGSGLWYWEGTLSHVWSGLACSGLIWFGYPVPCEQVRSAYWRHQKRL